MITAGFAAYGWLKQKFPTMVTAKPAGGDAVVLSAAIADSKSINRLAEAIERLIERSEMESDIAKLQAEIMGNRLSLIHGELRKINERAEYGSSTSVRS